MIRHRTFVTRLSLPVLLAVALAGCATQPTRSGFLQSYSDMQPRKMLRAKADQRKGGERLKNIHTIAIVPTVLYPSVKADWLTPEARDALLREIDAQLCFELTKRYQLAPLGQADARVRAAVTEVDATGRAGSAASAAAEVFIPGPLGVRPPGSTGGLSAEAEMLDKRGRQLAAITWNRDAMEIGTDNPALTRVGDALQFAEPFADAAAKAMKPPRSKKREIEKPDPCAEYGPRFRPEGFLTKMVTGLYVPEMSAAKDGKSQDAAAKAPANGD